MKTPSIRLLAALLCAGLITLPATRVTAEETTDKGPGKGERLERGERPPRGDRGRPGREVWEQLDLSNTQKAQLKALREKNAPAVKALRENFQQARRALTEAENDAAKDAARETLRKAQLAMAEHRAEAEKEMEAILNADQLAKLKELRAELETRMRERRERRQENHPKAPSETQLSPAPTPDQP